MSTLDDHRIMGRRYLSGRGEKIQTFLYHRQPHTRLAILTGSIGDGITSPSLLGSTRAQARRARWFPAAVLVFVIALLFRLIPVLRGGGLYGIGNYDDGVHFAAAVGLAHGLLPYRDFLFLHPPGIVLLLVPFAGLGQLIGDPTAFAIARVAAMLVGSLTAVLVMWLLRPIHPTAAVIGGLFYAVFWPAAHVERSTLLEGPQNTLLVISLLCIVPSASASRLSRHRLFIAGAVLGLSLTIKIWVLPVVVIIALAMLLGHGRRAGWFLCGGAAVCVAVCLPFFAAAPRLMWLMVVSDQLGRDRVAGLVGRLIVLTGLTPFSPERSFGSLLITVTLLFAACLLLALTVRRARFWVVVMMTCIGIVLSAPSTFPHYGALVAVPAALIIGAASGRLAILAGRVSRGNAARYRRAIIALNVVLIASLACYASTLPEQRFGARFPAADLAPAVRTLKGCVTADRPDVLFQLDVLGRNLDRGCPLLVDVSGAQFHPPLVKPGPLWRNRRWQTFALDYFRTGTVTIVARFGYRDEFSRASARTVDSWPVVASSGTFRVQRPTG